MIGPVLIILLILWASTEQSQPIPCAPNTCTQEQLEEEEKLPPIPVEMPTY